MKRILITCAVVIAFASIAAAQDEPRLGVTMGYPSAVGVLWRATNRIALRPEFTWTISSSESSSTDPISGSSVNSTPSNNWQTGAGLGALFYVSRINDLGVYLSPRLAYSRTSTTTNVSGTPVASSSDGWAWTTSGAFGAEYKLGRHFGLFGEIGLSYSATTFTTSTVQTITTFVPVVGPVGSVTTRTTTLTVRSDSHTHSFGTRSGAGVIFFF